jgi:ribosome-associated toxin RatA of RatAB toxin-antitoxin module
MLTDRFRSFAGLLSFLAGAFLPLPSAAFEGFSVTAKSDGHAVSVHAHALVKAPHALIWATLTDYDHLAEFIPGMASSKVLERRGPTAVVEQHGSAGFLFFSYDIEVVVASTEYKPEKIEVTVLKGNLKQLNGHYRVRRGKESGTYVLEWLGTIEPALSMPSFLGVPLIRGNIEDQFRGMVTEIERREALRQAAAAGGVKP